MKLYIWYAVVNMVKLVGILNITPDSFSDGGKYSTTETAISQADKLFSDGAWIVDVGAESTRPNADILTDDQEWQRLEPVLKVLIKKYPGKISVDSYHPNTYYKAFKIGPVIINDVTGLNNPKMVQAVLDLMPPKVIISQLPDMSISDAHRLIPIDTIEQVKTSLLRKAEYLIANGFSKKNIILDPGIGFGKTMELNEQLLTFAKEVPDYDVMIGYSKKRFLGENRMELEVNITAGKTSAKAGAKYLRVHDVIGHANI